MQGVSLLTMKTMVNGALRALPRGDLLTMTTLADRLRTALKQSGMNQSELARRIGVSRGAVSFWLTGATSSLAGDNLLKAAQALAISANWLASGRGSMRPVVAKEISIQENPDYPAIKRVTIKLSPDSTGFTVESIEGGHAPIVFSRSWYDSNGYKPDKLLAIRMEGASMEPGLYDGDWIILDTVDIAPKDGAVFAINFEGELAIKRLFKSNGSWTAASDNSDKRIYRDRPMSDSARILGRIVHKQSERI